MKALVIVLVIVVLLLLLGLAMALKIVKQYERGVLFRLGPLQGPRNPGLRLIIPFIDVLHRVSLRIVTMPIQSQGIITRDNVSVDVSAVAYFRVVDRRPRQRGRGWVRPSAQMVRTRATSSWRPQGRRRHAPGCRRGR